MKKTKNFRTLHFAFCIYFAFCILHSALILPAFAAEQKTDKGATISVTGSYDPNAYERVISVDVEWGSMVFTYRDGEVWDPQTHTNKEGGGWISEGNSIKITNHSNADILANLAFTPNVSGFGGSFYDAQSNKVSAVSLATAVGTLPAEAPSATVWFRAEEGTLTGNVESLGTLTVTLHDTLTAIDAREMNEEQLSAAVTAALANEPATLHITMPANANIAMLEAINDAIGMGTRVDLILYGMDNNLECPWNPNITVKFICGSHYMSVYTAGNGTSHTVKCANCDHVTTESCTLTHTSGGNGTHTSSCKCGYSATVDCILDNVVYTWAYDNSTCSASATCSECKTAFSETVDAAYNSEGVLVADFANALFETQTITHEHAWEGKTCTVCEKTKVTLELSAAGKGQTLFLTVPENVYEPSIAEAMEQVKNLTNITTIVVKSDVTDAQYNTIKNGRNGRAVYFENLTENNYIAANGAVYTTILASVSDEKYVLIVDELKQIDAKSRSNSAEAKDEIQRKLWSETPGARLVLNSESAWTKYVELIQRENLESKNDDGDSMGVSIWAIRNDIGAKQWSISKQSIEGPITVWRNCDIFWFPVFDVPLN